MRILKVFKGVTFILLGAVFFGVKFYNITRSAFVSEANGTFIVTNDSHFALYFEEFFKQTGINLVIAIMFIGIGILELLEIKGVVKNGN